MATGGGPFKANLRVDMSGWQKFKRILRKVAGLPELRIGLFDGELATIGAVHEWGSMPGSGHNIPERSFIRRTFVQKQKEISEMQGKLLGRVLDGKMSERQALGLLGAFVSSEVKKTITTGEPIPPPNNPETIRRKGSSRPLVDTGRMVGAITWRIS